MKKKYGEYWQKLLDTHIHFTIYKKQCYVSPERRTRTVPLEAFCHAFNHYQRVKSAFLSETESRINLFAQEINQQEVGQSKEVQNLPSGCWDSCCSTGGLLVTTDIERISHPPCSHYKDVAEQAQPMIYQPG